MNKNYKNYHPELLNYCANCKFGMFDHGNNFIECSKFKDSIPNESSCKEYSFDHKNAERILYHANAWLKENAVEDSIRYLNNQNANEIELNFNLPLLMHMSRKLRLILTWVTFSPSIVYILVVSYRTIAELGIYSPIMLFLIALFVQIATLYVMFNKIYKTKDLLILDTDYFIPFPQKGNAKLTWSIPLHYFTYKDKGTKKEFLAIFGEECWNIPINNNDISKGDLESFIINKINAATNNELS